MSRSTNASSTDDSSSNSRVRFLLQVALLCAVPPVLTALVAGNGTLVLTALPAFGLIFIIECFRSHDRLLQTCALVLPPTLLALSLGVSIRMDPTVPQAALVALPIVPTLAALVGYAALIPLSRRLQRTSPIRRGLVLYTVALLLGGALPAWTALSNWGQSAEVQTQQRTFAEQASVLDEKWTSDLGAITDVAPYESQLFVRSGASIAVLTPNGKTTRTIPLDAPRNLDLLHAGQLDTDSLPEFVVSGRGFASTIRAFDDDGSALWTYPPNQNDSEVSAPGSVHLTDLEGDGVDEIIVGSTTGGGLRVVTSSGKTSWADSSPGVVTDVTAADVADPEGSPEILAATGDAIHVYSADGTPLRTVTPDAQATTLTVAQDSSSPVFVVTHLGELPSLLVLTSDGTERWRGSLPTSDYATPSLSAASSQPWLAANNGNHAGSAYVYNLHSGRPLSVSDSSRSVRGVEWMTQESESPQLIGWNDQTLYGWRVPSPEGSGANR